MRSDIPGLVAATAAALLTACGKSPAPDDAPAPAPGIVRMEQAAQALAGTPIRTLDPATLDDAEILQVVDTGPHCTFRYTSAGRPVVVAGLGADGDLEVGVIKLNDKLVSLEPDRAATGLKPGGFALTAGRVRLRVQPHRAVDASSESQRVEAEMQFEIGQELKVGYDGYLTCKPGAPAPERAHP